MKKIYYAVEKDLEEIDGKINEYECVSGLKSIYLYQIDNNELQSIDNFETNIENISIDEIQNYLNDNGMGDEYFEFVLL